MIQNDDPQSSTSRSSAGFRTQAATGEVAELKRQRGRELQRPGGGGRAQTLMEHDLIDE